MNIRRGAITVTWIAVLSAGLGLWAVRPIEADRADDSANDRVAKFMRAKLDSSKLALEGLVTEDYGKIKQAAEKMLLMSKATEWQVIQGPVYAQMSGEFRRAVERLGKVADDKNIDGCSLAYMHVTMTCISCHKYVRGVKIARADSER